MSKKKDQDELLSSNYDGIQEYDNDLPKWWRMLFLITILFAVVYCGYYYLGFGPSSAEQLASQLEEIEDRRPPPSPSTVDTQTLLAYSKDPQRLAAGKAVFLFRCLPCHGADGQGVVGPNLTDEFWIHGGRLADIRHVIEEGVPEKGMLSWKTMLSVEEIDNVTAYIRSLAGTQPPNSKAPQGEKFVGDE